MLWAYQRSKFLNVPETFTQLGSFWGTVAFKIICSLYCASYVEALWNSKEKHTELEISTATHYDYVPVCTCLNVAHYGVLFFFTVFNNPLRRLMYLLCMHVCSPLVQFLYILPHMPNGSLLLIFLFIYMFLPTPLCLGASRGWCLGHDIPGLSWKVQSPESKLPWAGTGARNTTKLQRRDNVTSCFDMTGTAAD